MKVEVVMKTRDRRMYALACGLAAWALWASAAQAYIEAPYALGRIVAESTNILLIRIDKVDTDRNLIIYSKVKDLKGQHPGDVLRHNIGQPRGSFHPREWEYVMEWARPGRQALMFYAQGKAEICIDSYWYQTYLRGEWWEMIHGEPYLLRTFCGRPERLATAVTAMLAGKEVIVTCMADGDKNAIQLRAGRIQRMRASLKLQDYNPQRDFVGWGNDEFQRLDGMPGFSHLGALPPLGARGRGVVAADFNGDGQQDLCLYGEDRVIVLQSAGLAMEEIGLPYSGGARAAAWGDWNGDGQIDLLLATPAGIVLLSNQRGTFKNDSDLIPRESYYNVTAAAWIDFDGDGRQDILLANGFMGLRLYRNVAAEGSQPARFVDVSERVGLGMNGAAGHVKGDRLLVADVNGDGRPDFLYSAGEGVLVLNTPRGFVESKDSGIAFKAGGITPVFGDVTGDGAVDLFVPQAGGSKLFRNDGRGRFTDITAASGDLARLDGGATSAVLVDLGGRGRKDLLVGCLNGPNRIFRNNGNGVFADVTAVVGLHQRTFGSMAVCVADVNKDGVPDFIWNSGADEVSVLLGASALAGLVSGQ